jgi:hypothetical protein
MTVHLIKLCVGIESPRHLERVQAGRIADSEARTGRRVAWHVTRRTPKRAPELRDGGSLYWVMRGQIRARQAIRDVRGITDGNGRAACVIELDPTIVPVTPRARKAFQGWRYLAPDHAPPDQTERSDDTPEMPDWMVAELTDLGLL